MFNAPVDNSSNPQELWKILGTFYDNLLDEDKKPFEEFWDTLVQTKEAAFYNLYQSDLQTYLQNMEGWFEVLDASHRIIFNDLEDEGQENTRRRYLSKPLYTSISHSQLNTGTNKYSYVITAVNQYGETRATKAYNIYDASDITVDSITLSWDPVTGADSYRVYGRSQYDYQLVGTVGTETITDDGSAFEDASKTPPSKNTALDSYLFKIDDNKAYLHMPILEQKSTKHDSVAGFATWEQDVDYYLEGADTIRLKAYVNEQDPNVDRELGLETDEFLSPSSLTVAPIISEFYFPVFGKPNPKGLFSNRKYNSKDPSYSTATSQDQALMYGDHLKYFTWGYSYFLRKAPTLSNLRTLWAMVNDYPFAYEAGEVTAINGSVISIGDIDYDVSPGTPIVSIGDKVERFEILCGGITVEDYYSDPTLISNNAPAGEQQEFFIYLGATHTFSPDQDLIDKFKEISIPAGLKILQP